jgi:hypothetical protein
VLFTNICALVCVILLSSEGLSLTRFYCRYYRLRHLCEHNYLLAKYSKLIPPSNSGCRRVGHSRCGRWNRSQRPRRRPYTSKHGGHPNSLPLSESSSLSLTGRKYHVGWYRFSILYVIEISSSRQTDLSHNAVAICTYTLCGLEYLRRYTRDLPVRGQSPLGTAKVTLTPQIRLMISALGFSTPVLFIRYAPLLPFTICHFRGHGLNGNALQIGLPSRRALRRLGRPSHSHRCISSCSTGVWSRLRSTP